MFNSHQSPNQLHDIDHDHKLGIAPRVIKTNKLDQYLKETNQNYSDSDLLLEDGVCYKYPSLNNHNYSIRKTKNTYRKNKR